MQKKTIDGFQLVGLKEILPEDETNEPVGGEVLEDIFKQKIEQRKIRCATFGYKNTKNSNKELANEYIRRLTSPELMLYRAAFNMVDVDKCGFLTEDVAIKLMQTLDEDAKDDKRIILILINHLTVPEYGDNLWKMKWIITEAQFLSLMGRYKFVKSFDVKLHSIFESFPDSKKEFFKQKLNEKYILVSDLVVRATKENMALKSVANQCNEMKIINEELAKLCFNPNIVEHSHNPNVAYWNLTERKKKVFKWI